MARSDEDLTDGQAAGGEAAAGRPRREPVFNMPPVVLAVIGVCVAVFVLQSYLLTPDRNLDLIRYGAFIPVIYTGKYGFDAWAFTSPFTYTLLHGSVLHLAVNMVWLAAFGSPLENRLGALRFTLFFAVTGLAAAFFFFILHPYTQAPLVGASGAISGMMAAAARFAFRIDRTAGRGAFAGAPLPFGAVARSRSVMTFLAVWMVINLVTGLVGFVPGNEDQIAWEAHIGGFLAGFLGLRFFDRPQGPAS